MPLWLPPFSLLLSADSLLEDLDELFFLIADVEPMCSVLFAKIENHLSCQ